MPTPRVTDETFPALSRALDENLVGQLIQDHLDTQGSGVAVERVRISHVLHVPKKRCHIVYSTRLRDRKGTSARQIITANLLRADAQGHITHDIETEPPPHPSDGLIAPVRFHPAGEAMDLSIFPNDPSLPMLMVAANDAAMKDLFNEHWGKQRLRVREVNAELLGYTPGARAAFKYRVVAEDRGTGIPQTRTLVGKIDQSRKADERFAISLALWRSLDNRVRMAAPVDYFPSINMEIQEFIAGTRLSDLAGNNSFVKFTRQLARALALFHQQDVPLISSRMLKSEALYFDRWRESAIAILPEESERITRLIDRISTGVEEQMRISAPIHGDLHPSNILVIDDRISIIDVDNVVYGDPLIDVGRLLSTLRISSHRVFGDVTRLSKTGEAFLKTYLENSDEDEARARLFEARALMMSVNTGYRLQRSDWKEMALAILAESEQAYEKFRKGRLQPVKATAHSLCDTRRWLEDPVYMAATIGKMSENRSGTDIRKARIVSISEKKTQTIVEYRLKGLRAGEPWRQFFTGVAWRDISPKRLYEQTKAFKKINAATSPTPLLAQPIGSLSNLGVIITEKTFGTRFRDAVKIAEPRSLGAGLGRQLAAVHGADLKLRRKRDLASFLALTVRQVDLLAETDLGAKAQALCGVLGERLDDQENILAPIMRSLNPENLQLTSKGYFVLDFANPVLGHPLYDVGEFLARLRRKADRKDADPQFEAIAQGLLEAYFDATDFTPRETNLFEATHYLRLTALDASNGSERPLAAQRLAVVESLLNDAERPTIAVAGKPAARRPQGKDKLPVESLYQAIARRCSGKTVVISTSPSPLCRMFEGGVDSIRINPSEQDAATILTDNISESFDTVVFDMILACIDEDAGNRLLDASRSILNSQGKFIVCVPNEDLITVDGQKREFCREDLRRRLKQKVGDPKFKTDQPMKWLLAEVALNRQPNKYERKRLDILADLCAGTVLELGCGWGHLTHTISQRGLQVTGVDLNVRKIDEARIRYPVPIFHAVDILRYDADGQKFNTVLLPEVLEHVAADVGLLMLEKAVSLVEPGGRIVVSVPNENSIPHPNHIREFTRGDLLKLLEPYGTVGECSDQPFKWLIAYADIPTH